MLAWGGHQSISVVKAGHEQTLRQESDCMVSPCGVQHPPGTGPVLRRSAQKWVTCCWFMPP